MMMVMVMVVVMVMVMVMMGTLVKIIMIKVNVGVQDLQIQRRAMELVSNPTRGKGSPMAGPGWKRRPSKTTSATLKT